MSGRALAQDATLQALIEQNQRGDFGQIGVKSGGQRTKSRGIGFRRDHQRPQSHLRRAQQALSRKQKGSNNRCKARLRVARLHARIADRRRDFLHKLSTTLIRENQAIYLEDLNVRGMMQNHHLARAIGSASWNEFVRQVEYKAVRYGRTALRVGRFEPTSKRCSVCNHQVKELPLSVRAWTCEACGSRHDRDVNAARNILAAGQAVPACGESVSPGVSTSGNLWEAGILAL